MRLLCFSYYETKIHGCCGCVGEKQYHFPLVLQFLRFRPLPQSCRCDGRLFTRFLYTIGVLLAWYGQAVMAATKQQWRHTLNDPKIKLYASNESTTIFVVYVVGERLHIDSRGKGKFCARWVKDVL